MNTVDWIARILVIIGALNWGLVIFSADIGGWGIGSTVANVIYALIGLAGIWEVIKLFRK